MEDGQSLKYLVLLMNASLMKLFERSLCICLNIPAREKVGANSESLAKEPDAGDSTVSSYLQDCSCQH